MRTKRNIQIPIEDLESSQDSGSDEEIKKKFFKLKKKIQKKNHFFRYIRFSLTYFNKPFPDIVTTHSSGLEKALIYLDFL